MSSLKKLWKNYRNSMKISVNFSLWNFRILEDLGNSRWRQGLKAKFYDIYNIKLLLFIETMSQKRRIV